MSTNHYSTMFTISPCQWMCSHVSRWSGNVAHLAPWSMCVTASWSWM